jgi:hypothetical protein
MRTSATTPERARDSLAKKPERLQERDPDGLQPPESSVAARTDRTGPIACTNGTFARQRAERFPGAGSARPPAPESSVTIRTDKTRPVGYTNGTFARQKLKGSRTGPARPPAPGIQRNGEHRQNQACSLHQWDTRSPRTRTEPWEASGPPEASVAGATDSFCSCVPVVHKPGAINRRNSFCPQANSAQRGIVGALR